MCGFDSVPSDITAFATAQALSASGCEVGHVQAYFDKLKGGASGGTLHTMLHIFASSSWKELYRMVWAGWAAARWGVHAVPVKQILPNCDFYVGCI